MDAHGLKIQGKGPRGFRTFSWGSVLGIGYAFKRRRGQIGLSFIAFLCDATCIQLFKRFKLVYLGEANLI